VERKPVHPVKEKAQETKRKIRRTEEDEAACMARAIEEKSGIHPTIEGARALWRRHP